MHAYSHIYIHTHTHWLILLFLVVFAYRKENYMKSWIKMQRKNHHTWQSSSKRAGLREKRLRFKCETWLSVNIKTGGKSGRHCGVKRETSTMRQSCRRLWRREEIQTQRRGRQDQPKKDIVTLKSNYILSIIWITSADTGIILTLSPLKWFLKTEILICLSLKSIFAAE